jgi:hypothetical protein
MTNLKAIFCITSLFLSAMVLEATPAFAAHAYEMMVVPPTSAIGINVYRIDTATGSVASINGLAYAPTADPTPLPQGDYHLRYAQSFDGKTFWVYRMDSQTGHSWSLGGTGWVAITDPK